MPGDSLKDYISTKEASDRYGLAQEHLSRLAGGGVIEGVKLARNWLLYVPSLEKYMKNRPKRGPKPHSRSGSKKEKITP